MLIFFGIIVLLAFVINIIYNVLIFKRKIQGGRKAPTHHTTSGKSSTQKKKIIPQDEGEYVDFEEVKP